MQHLLEIIVFFVEVAYLLFFKEIRNRKAKPLDDPTFSFKEVCPFACVTVVETSRSEPPDLSLSERELRWISRSLFSVVCALCSIRPI